MCCDTREPCRKGAWSEVGTGTWIGRGLPDHGLVQGISGCIFNSVIFLKATKAAFAAIQCTKIRYSWLTLPAN